MRMPGSVMTEAEIRRALHTLTELQRIPLEARTEAEDRFIYRWRTWLEIHPEYDPQPRLSDVRWPGNPPGGET